MYIKGKAAGNDKRLLKQLESKFANNGNSGDSGESEDLETNIVNNNSSTVLNSSNGITLKTFYYLISTMNNMFPDYDFTDIPTEAFKRIFTLPTLINHFNTSIFNTGINRNTSSFADFTRQMWDCMDEAVGGLEESEIFTFDPATDSYEIDDPFRERGTIWSLNAFFYNRKLKRVLVFQARQMNDFNFDDLTGIRSGSVTPISSA